jgi:hypothetical protein
MAETSPAMTFNCDLVRSRAFTFYVMLALVAGTTSLRHFMTSKTWMAPEVGLARLPYKNEPQVGYIRLAGT